MSRLGRSPARSTLPTRLGGVAALLAGVLVLARCGRGDDVPRVDTVITAAPPVPPAPAQEAPAPSGWDPRAGPVLLVAGERSDAAIVVFPEVQGEHVADSLRLGARSLRRSSATLLNRAGAAMTVTLGDSTAPGEEEHCVGWPMVRVASPSGTVAPWAVGFVDARLAPVLLDSVESLPPADSAALVAEVARLASTIPVRAVAARMRGLPFSVREVWRFRPDSVTDAIVALVVRRIHQEASPLEERTLLIAERDTAQKQRAAGRYTLVFNQRAAGPEETLEGTDVLAAVANDVAPLRPMLVIARESEGGVRYALLERTGPRRWHVKWTSALVRC